MGDEYCGACDDYSYVERYGRGGWQFGFCQNKKCIRSWERKKRRHAKKHKKVEQEEYASRKYRRYAYNTLKDEEECASVLPPTVQQLFPAKTTAVESKPSEKPSTPPSSRYSSSDDECYEVIENSTQTDPVFVFGVTEKYEDEYAAFKAFKRQRKSAVASKPSSEPPLKITEEVSKQLYISAMKLRRKRVHVSHETVIEDVSNSEGAEEKKKKRKKNKSVKESRRNSSRKDKKFKQ